MHGRHATHRIRILVKAFPQPSQKHEETVCCAGITEDDGEFLRLYPIRFRRLDPANRFKRYDLVEMTVTRVATDRRPESRHIDEDSIRLIETGDRLSEESKVRLWRAFIAPSIQSLIDDNKATRRSLGIIKPDPGTLQFIIKDAAKSSQADREVASLLYQQASLLEDSLKPLKRPKHNFYYRFTCKNPEACTCAGNPHNHEIHDWEVQAAFINYMRRYKTEEKALEMMTWEYQENIPQRNLHFVMGTMKAHPQTFIVIGLLRSGIAPETLDQQTELF